MPRRTVQTDRTTVRHRLTGRGRALLPAVAAWLLVACSANEPGADLASLPADMTVVADLASGPSCGKILICIVQCGLDKLGCTAQCTAGANATEGMKAGTLALCAALHCASPELGTGLPAVLGCLLASCKSEVLGCDGLF